MKTARITAAILLTLATSAAYSASVLSSAPSAVEVPAVGDSGAGGLLFPLGWSREGRFAYIAEERIGAPADYWQLRLSVIDLVEDEELLVRRYDSGPGFSGGARPDMGAFWAARSEEVLDALATEGIVRQPAFKLLPPRFVAAGREYLLEAACEVEERPFVVFEGPTIGVRSVVGGELRISSPALGAKTVTRFGEKPYPEYSMLRPLGAFLSPYEKRIAVLCGAAGFDAEGGREDSCLVFGAHLAVGFSKALGPLGVAAAAKSVAPSALPPSTVKPAASASTASSAAKPATTPFDAEFNALGLAAKCAAMGPRFAEELWFAVADAARPEGSRRSLRFSVEDGAWTVAVGEGGKAAARYVIVGVEREGCTYYFATGSREFAVELPAEGGSTATFRGMVSGAYEIAR